MRELVNLAADPEIGALVIAEAETVVAANQPAEPLEAAYLVRRLMNHYRTAEMSERDMQGVVEDWIEDLGEIPYDILKDGLSSWRRGERAGFKPQAGEILALCQKNAGFRMALAKRAAEVLSTITKERAA